MKGCSSGTLSGMCALSLIAYWRMRETARSMRDDEAGSETASFDGGRISPSCVALATSRPSWAKKRPHARPRASPVQELRPHEQPVTALDIAMKPHAVVDARRLVAAHTDLHAMGTIGRGE